MPLMKRSIDTIEIWLQNLRREYEDPQKNGSGNDY